MSDDERAAAPVGTEASDDEELVWEDVRRLGVADHDIAFLRHVVRQAFEAKTEPRPPTPKHIQKALLSAKKSCDSLIKAINDMGEGGRAEVDFYLALRDLQTNKGIFNEVGDLLSLRDRLHSLLLPVQDALESADQNDGSDPSSSTRQGRQPGQWQDRALMAIRMVILGPPWSESIPHGGIERLARAIDHIFGPETFGDSRNQAERALSLHDTYDLIVLRASYSPNASKNGEEVSG